MTYLIKFLWVLGVAAVLWVVNWFAQRGAFRKAKASMNGTRLQFDLTNWNVYFRIFSVVVLILAALLSGCNANFSASGSPFPDWLMNIFMVLGWISDKLGLS